MGIQLEQQRTTGSPVLRGQTIGEKFVGGIVKFETRNILKDGEPVLKDNGKPRQELVVWLLTKEATMTAGIGGEENVPQRGQIVRDILKGGGFAQWIEAKNGLNRGIEVGDLYYRDVTHAVRYNSSTFKELGRIDTNDDLDDWRQSPANIDRKESLGRRGDLKIRAPKDDEAAFVAECEQAYHQLTREGIKLDEDPFPGPAASSDEPW